MGTPEARDQQPDYSYESFAQRPFYKDLNMRLLRHLPEVQTLTDFATGTGAFIEHLLELDKLRTPFIVTGIDIDESGLAVARKKFLDYLPGQKKFPDYLPNQEVNVIIFRNTSVTDTHIVSLSQQGVTIGHSFHLFDEPEAVLYEAHRITVPSGFITLITGYEAELGYPDEEARTQWKTLPAMARRILRKTYGYTQFKAPKDYFRYSANQYLEWLKKAGYKDIIPRFEIIGMDRDDMRAICSYHEFARGTFPNIPIEHSIPALVNAVDPAFERMKTNYFKRGWWSFIAKRV